MKGMRMTQMGALLYQSHEKALLFEKLPHGWRSLGRAVLWQRFGSKLLVDATIPPPADAAARAKFERIRPPNPDIRLEDFVAEGSLGIVCSLAPIFFGSKLLG